MKNILSHIKGIHTVRKGQIEHIQQGTKKASLKQCGQGMVEFALVIPLLIFLLIGIIEFGYFFFVYVTANTAVREAVRYGAGIGDSANGGNPYFQDCAGIREVATRIGRYANIQDTNVVIDYDDGPSDLLPNATCSGPVGTYVPDLGTRIVVHIDVEYRPIILFGGRNQPLTVIRAESARTVIRDVQLGG